MPGQEALLDVLAAVLEDALDEVAEARPGRRAGRRQLLVEDHVVDARQPVAADRRSATTCRRSRRRRATGARRPGRPSSRRRSTRPAARGCWSRSHVAQPRSGTPPRRASHRSPSPSRLGADPVVGEHPVEARVRAAEDVAREQRPAQVDVGQALPRVADAAVHLDGGLAHRAGGPGAVGLGHRGGGQRLGRRERVDRPRRVERDAARALHGDERVGQQVLHRLERADRSRRTACATTAYSQARSTAPRIVPTRSAQVSASPRAVQRARSSSVSGRPSSGATWVAAGERHRRPGQVDGHRAGRQRRPDRPGSRSARPRAPAPRSRPRRRRRRSRGHARRRPLRPGRAGPASNATVSAAVAAGGAGQPPELGGERRPEERRVGQAAPELLGDDGGLDARRPRRAGRRRRCAARASRPRRPRRRAWRPARRRRAGPTACGPSRSTTCAAESRSARCSGERRTSISRPSGRSRAAAPTRRAACGAAPCRTAAAGWRRRRRRGAGACRWPASRRRAARAPAR